MSLPKPLGSRRFDTVYLRGEAETVLSRQDTWPIHVALFLQHIARKHFSQVSTSDGRHSACPSQCLKG